MQALIIAFTSDMIPRLVYYWSFSVPPYGSHSTHTMEGYINSTLSVFNISDFKNESKPSSPWLGKQTTCRQVSKKYLSFSNYKNSGFYIWAIQFSKQYPLRNIKTQESPAYFEWQNGMEVFTHKCYSENSFFFKFGFLPADSFPKKHLAIFISNS